MKRVFGAVCFSLFINFSVACPALHAQSQETAQKTKIGVALPLSGDLQAPGEDLRNSFLVAKDFLHADDLELLFEDDRCDAKQSVTVTHKLLELDNISIATGVYCNHALFPAAPLYNRKGIPVITTGATTGDVKGIGPKIYRLFPADHLGVKPLLKAITARHKRLCMLTAPDTYTELIQRTVKKEFAALPPPFTLIAMDADAAAQDFRTPLLNLTKNNSCDALFLNPPGDDTFITMMKRVREQRTNLPIYGFYMPGSTVVRKALGDQLNGVEYADLPSREDVASDLGRQFLDAYKKRFGDFQVAQPIGLMAFEALRLIVESKKAGTPLDEFIRNRPIKDGALKEYRFDDDGAIEGIAFKIYRYENGSATEVKPAA